MENTKKMEKLDNGNIIIKITIPWVEIEKELKILVEKAAETAELPGFRKGKAPVSLVEDKLDKQKLFEEAIKILIPKYYSEAVADYKIRPVINPHIELEKAKEKEDWIISVTTCEKPIIELGNYKEKIKLLVPKKDQKIWLPGEKPEKTDENKEKLNLDDILMTLYEAIKIQIPAVMIDSEVQRLLSELIDQTRKLGLTIEQYLASTGRTSESLRQDYVNQASRTLALEFALEEIAEKESITVDDKEIDSAIEKAKDQKEKDALAKERYYLASIIRRQKTIEYLAKLNK